MDDPWAAGPSWSSSDDKKSSPTAETAQLPGLGMKLPRDLSAHRFEADDPWGATGPRAGSDSTGGAGEQGAVGEAEAALAGMVESPRKESRVPDMGEWGEVELEGAGWGARAAKEATPPDSRPRQEDHTETAEAPSPAVASTALPRHSIGTPQADAVWSLNSPKADLSSLPASTTQDTLPIDSQDLGETSPSHPADIPPPKSPDIATPPPTFSALPALTSPVDVKNFASPHSVLSRQSRLVHSHHDSFESLHSLPGGRVGDLRLGDGTGGFAGLGDLPKSLSFGEEGFGGFATGFGGDPWGGGDSWGAEGGTFEGSTKRSSYQSPVIEQGGDEDEDEGEGGWGGVRNQVERAPKSGMDEEWEEAQWRIRVQEERAPRERIQKLQNNWREVAVAMIGLQKLEAPPEDEERRFEVAVKKLAGESAETLRSLSTIPPDINTYPPVLSNFNTHKTYQSALSRPNPNPSSSLLHIPVVRRTRLQEDFGLGVTRGVVGWTSRSRLGEPETLAVEAPVQEESTKSRWSFWGKKVGEKQLVTSGGGMLEVKALTPTSSTPGSISNVPGTVVSPVNAQERKSTSSRSASIASGRPSRPGSPSHSVTGSFPAYEDAGHVSPSGTISPSIATPSGTQGQPSAVSRFLGRFGRRGSHQANSAQAEAEAGDAKDLELGEDDFSFLADVPSIASPPPQEKGMGALLSFEPGRSEGIASLESMLSSKPAPLPQPLAPPPSGPRAQMYGRTASEGSSRFVAKMKSAPSDMDLLGGLDFGDTPPHASPGGGTPTQAAATISGGGSAWDEFLAPSASAGPAAASTPVPSAGSSTPPILPGPPMARKPPPSNGTFQQPISFTSPPLPVARMSNVSPAVPPAAKPAKPVAFDDFGDFDDFGTPQKGVTSGKHADGGFDDFGDFDSFAPVSTPSPFTAVKPAMTPQSTPSFAVLSSRAPIAISHIKSPSGDGFTIPVPGAQNLPTQRAHAPLDHTTTLSLLTHSTSLKGKRWPAPPSPIAPPLEPPPKPASSRSAAPGGLGGFPFLSPPPPGRPASGLGLGIQDVGDLLGGADGSVSAEPGGVKMMPSSSSGSGASIGSGSAFTASSFGLAPTPPRSSPPSTKPAQATAPSTSAVLGAKGGLSAQDLSFFDNL